MKKEITDSHVYLMTSYIASMVLDYSLSNVRSTNTFVRDFKKKTNNYSDFLNSEVYKRFQEVFDLDEEMSEKIFSKLNKRVESLTNSFIDYMIKEE